MVVVAESSWRTAFLLLEDAVEVADVVEAAVIANLCHAGFGIHKKAGCIAETDVDDVVAYRLPCASTEEAAEGSWCHAGNIGECLQTYLSLEVLVDIFLNGTHTTALW